MMIVVSYMYSDWSTSMQRRNRKATIHLSPRQLFRVKIRFLT